MSLSRDDDIFAFTVKNPDYSVGGYAVWQRSTNKILYTVRTSTLDEVQIDKTGRYLVVKTDLHGAGAIEVKIVDLQTMVVADLTDNTPDFAPGHSDNGTGTTVGASNYSNSITFRNLATPHELHTVLSFGNNWDTNYHISLLDNNEDWALFSFYGQMAGAFNGELVLVATDGSQRVKRFAHHYSVFQSYYDTPRANISRDGRYIAFSSNWGGSSRRDLFIAQAPPVAEDIQISTPTPTPVPTPVPVDVVPTPTPTPVPTPVPVDVVPTPTPTPTPARAKGKGSLKWQLSPKEGRYL
jgi:cell division septation protein DedD